MFYKSRFLNKTTDFKNVLTKFKNGDKESAQSDLVNLYHSNLQKAVGQVCDTKHANYYNFDVNARKFAEFKANRVIKTLENAAHETDFDTISKAIISTFNRYQVTEYVTTVNRCRTAEQFKAFQKTKDVYPHVRWVASRSANPREEHMVLWGMVFRLDDAFLADNQPGSLYNCKCDLEPCDDPVSNNIPEDVSPAQGLEGNPYQTKEIFTDNHTYIKDSSGSLSDIIGRKMIDYIWSTFNKVDGVNVHPMAVESIDYSNVLSVGKLFAKKSEPVYVLPNVDKDSVLYKEIYKGVEIVGKKPDLKVGEKFIEVKSGKIGNAIRKAKGQAKKVVFIINDKSTDNYIKKLIFEANKSETVFSEVWVKRKSMLKKLI